MGMIDMEKVIEALEACVLKDPDDSRDCKHCPRCNYGAFITNSCINGVMADCLSLLKEQEPQKMLEVEDDDLYAWSQKDVSYYCPRPECGKEISYDYNFCPYCGQAVKLND